MSNVKMVQKNNKKKCAKFLKMKSSEVAMKEIMNQFTN